MSNPLAKIVKKHDDAIDNAIYGKNEDMLVRNARRQAFDDIYGNRFLRPLIPEYGTYRSIKRTIANSELSTVEKAGRTVIDLTALAVIRVAQVGMFYSLYQFDQYLDSLKP